MTRKKTPPKKTPAKPRTKRPALKKLPAKKKPAPITEATGAARHRELITNLILRGYRRAEILEYVARNHENLAWHPTPQEFESALIDANTSIIDRINTDPIKEFATAISRLEDLFKESRIIQDYKTSFSIQKTLIDLIEKRSELAKSTTSIETLISVLHGLRSHLCPNCQTAIDTVIANARQQQTQ